MYSFYEQLAKFRTLLVRVLFYAYACKHLKAQTYIQCPACIYIIMAWVYYNECFLFILFFTGSICCKGNTQCWDTQHPSDTAVGSHVFVMI